MDIPSQWRRNPRPDSRVVLILEEALSAARRGHVHSIVIVTCSPLRETETALAGDLAYSSETLIGAMIKGVHQLAKIESQ